jgi:hypothetical protein
VQAEQDSQQTGAKLISLFTVFKTLFVLTPVVFVHGNELAKAS